MKPLSTIPHRAHEWEQRMGSEGKADFGCYLLPMDLFKAAAAIAGVYVPPSTGTQIAVIASTHGDWDHLSVSIDAPRCPSWTELEFVKRVFFHPDETAMQLHVPPADHVNIHPYCLHLWRPQTAEIPRPPQWMVA